MKVAVVSANEEISATELAFGLIRDMMAAGLGKLQNKFPQLIYLFVYLFIYICIYLFTYLFIYLFIYSFIYLFIQEHLV